ncbi:hypothetical protein V8G54_009676 [Vigna mungo]|uniref:TMV resistance protein N n=1 Tax=Vigna mungo TaxID=3915 RepID=A0AAQ3NV98_VIGMU
MVQGFTTNEFCDVFLPGDNYPLWLTHTGEGHSVLFKVPEDRNCLMTGMFLCVVYSSPLERVANECLLSVLIVNYTKCTIQIYKRETIISFSEEDWKEIISQLGFGDQVEIFVTFGHELIVMKMAIYLLYTESTDMPINPSLEPKENVLLRFLKRIVMCDFW